MNCPHILLYNWPSKGAKAAPARFLWMYTISLRGWPLRPRRAGLLKYASNLICTRNWRPPPRRSSKPCSNSHKKGDGWKSKEKKGRKEEKSAFSSDRDINFQAHGWILQFSLFSLPSRIYCGRKRADQGGLLLRTSFFYFGQKPASFASSPALLLLLFLQVY